MAKSAEYNGEKFQLDDSKGCYVEVAHKRSGLIGYVGVNLGMMPRRSTRIRGRSWACTVESQHQTE